MENLGRRRERAMLVVPDLRPNVGLQKATLAAILALRRLVDHGDEVLMLTYLLTIGLVIGTLAWLWSLGLMLYRWIFLRLRFPWYQEVTIWTLLLIGLLWPLLLIARIWTSVQ